jgi:hypothetical protein
MKKNLVLLICLVPIVIFGQEKAIPINISLYNEATAIPFTRFFTSPIHPGIQLGTEYNWMQKERARLFQTANIHYYYHRYLAQGIGLNTEIAYEYRLGSRFTFAGLLGIGYLHTFATAEEFYFSNGQYQKKTDFGNARLSPSLSLEIGYLLQKSEINSPKMFIRYQSWAEYPYSPDFIPVMTHISLHVGANFFINLKNKRNA